MNAAAYIRVSSKAQTLEMQREALERAARARGDRIPLVRWKRKVPALSPAPNACGSAPRRAAARNDAYTSSVSIGSRAPGSATTFEVVEALRAAGVELVTIADGFDLTGPAAEVVLAVMAWAAEMERLAINERIAAARAPVRGPRVGTAAPAHRARRGPHPHTARTRPGPFARSQSRSSTRVRRSRRPCFPEKMGLVRPLKTSTRSSGEPSPSGSRLSGRREREQLWLTTTTGSAAGSHNPAVFDRSDDPSLAQAAVDMRIW